MEANRTTAAAQIHTTGTVVSYEDMANPRRVGIVVEIQDNPWSTFGIRWEDGEFSYSDCRQRGWKVAA